MYHNIGEAYYPNLYILLSAHFIFASCHITFQCGYVALRNAVFEPILVAPVSKKSMYISIKIQSLGFFKRVTKLL